MTQVNALAIDPAGRLVVSGQVATGAVVARYTLGGGVASVPVVEFFNTLLGHYFVTAGPGEIAIIESGGAGPGWQRTGLGFRAYIPEAGVAVAALAVCRFYGTPGIGPNSHFYTADAAECAAVKSDPGWTYEGIAFYIPVPAGGQCASTTTPVYRAYNKRFAQNDSNHRYASDVVVYNAMVAQGWTGEGVVMCSAR
jgi:serine protease